MLEKRGIEAAATAIAARTGIPPTRNPPASRRTDAMPEFSSSGGVSIAYEVAGQGKPMLLVHGFAATAEDNWRRTGWVQALTRARRQAVTFDLQGAWGQRQALRSGRLHDRQDGQATRWR